LIPLVAISRVLCVIAVARQQPMADTWQRCRPICHSAPAGDATPAADEVEAISLKKNSNEVDLFKLAGWLCCGWRWNIWVTWTIGLINAPLIRAAHSDRMKHLVVVSVSFWWTFEELIFICGRVDAVKSPRVGLEEFILAEKRPFQYWNELRSNKRILRTFIERRNESRADRWVD
jgi:hypothetical protein